MKCMLSSQICHRVAVMEEGRVVESGEVIEVFKNHNNPLQNNLLRRTWMMKSMKYSITYQRPFAQG